MLVCSYQEQRIAAAEASEGPGASGGSSSYDRRLPPPPATSRLPPDGHEFPAAYTDSIPPPQTLGGSASAPQRRRSSNPQRSRSRDDRDIILGGGVSSTFGGDGTLLSPSSTCHSASFTSLVSGGSTSSSPSHQYLQPPVGGSTSLLRTSSLSSRWRRQDEKSEKSVRDKIAMFSPQTKGKKYHRDTDGRNLSTSSFESSPETTSTPMIMPDYDCTVSSEQSQSADVSTDVSHCYSEVDVRTPSVESGEGQNSKLSKQSAFSSMINVSSSESQQQQQDCVSNNNNASMVGLPSGKVKSPVSDADTSIRNSSSPTKKNRKKSTGATTITLPAKASITGISTRKSSTGQGNKTSQTSSCDSLHHRSQSLMDIDKSSPRGKRHSVGAYDRLNQNTEKPSSEERDRRTSLANLVDLRRKSLSKLRGLVIPESKSGDLGSISSSSKGTTAGSSSTMSSNKPPIDLPRIGSCTPPLPTSSFTPPQKTSSLPRDVNRSHHHQKLYKTDSISSIDSCESNTSKQSVSNITTTGGAASSSSIARFSPAVKRKGSAISRPDSLPPAGSRLTRSCSPAAAIGSVGYSPGTPTLVSPQRHSSSIASCGLAANSDSSFDSCCMQQEISRSAYTKFSLVSKFSMDSRMDRSEDSDDDDSAVSSTRSSFSQGITPPASPVPADSSDLDECRTSSMRHSNGSRVRHSPQCSIDELDPKRVLKTGTVEAENRRNVIKSAKCSSGRSSDEQSTPELSRKSSVSKKDSGYSHRLESDIRGVSAAKTSSYRRQSSAESSSTLAPSSRRSSQESRRNSRDSVIHVPTKNTSNDPQKQPKLCAEQVYFDKEGDMYRESDIKVAYVNEITDNFEQIPESSTLSSDVLAEVPLSSGFSNSPTSAFTNPKASELNINIKNVKGISAPPPSDDKWAALELKYGKSSKKNDIEYKISKLRSNSDSSPCPSPVSMERNTPVGISSSSAKSDRKSSARKTGAQISGTNNPNGGKGFKALAEKWKQRAEVAGDDEIMASPSPPTVIGGGNTSMIFSQSNQQCGNALLRPANARQDEPIMIGVGNSTMQHIRPSSLQLTSGRSDHMQHHHVVPDRKLSMPEYSSAGVGIRMRDNSRRSGASGSDGGSGVSGAGSGTVQSSGGDMPSRPSSLIENSSCGTTGTGGGGITIINGEPVMMMMSHGGLEHVYHHQQQSSYLTPTSPAVSGSTDSLDGCNSSSLSRASSKEVLEAFSKARPLGSQFGMLGHGSGSVSFQPSGNGVGTGSITNSGHGSMPPLQHGATGGHSGSVSSSLTSSISRMLMAGGGHIGGASGAPPRVSDIMRAFEYRGMTTSSCTGGNSAHPRVSSMDSAASDDGSIGNHYGSVTSLASGTRDQYGSITSLASSTSIISSQELACLIEEANQSLEESGTPCHEIVVVVLHRELAGYGSVGVTLAGGADYDTREVTVHKIIPGSLADRDGRIQRGDRVLSINGRTLRGVTHREALAILKSPRPEVVLVLSRSRSVTPQDGTTAATGAASDDICSNTSNHRSNASVFINHLTSRPPKILESPMDSKSLMSELSLCPLPPRGPPQPVSLVKDGAGLGFSLEGGKDSPLGDRPLTVKKIFAGGAADKGGLLSVGDELLSVNSVDVTVMARIEAWNFLKKLPDGTVSLVIRQKLPSGSEAVIQGSGNETVLQSSGIEATTSLKLQNIAGEASGIQTKNDVDLQIGLDKNETATNILSQVSTGSSKLPGHSFTQTQSSSKTKPLETQNAVITSIIDNTNSTPTTVSTDKEEEEKVASVNDAKIINNTDNEVRKQYDGCGGKEEEDDKTVEIRSNVINDAAGGAINESDARADNVSAGVKK